MVCGYLVGMCFLYCESRIISFFFFFFFFCFLFFFLLKLLRKEHYCIGKCAVAPEISSLRQGIAVSTSELSGG